MSQSTCSLPCSVTYIYEAKLKYMVSQHLITGGGGIRKQVTDIETGYINIHTRIRKHTAKVTMPNRHPGLLRAAAGADLGVQTATTTRKRETPDSQKPSGMPEIPSGMLRRQEPLVRKSDFSCRLADRNSFLSVVPVDFHADA